MKYIIRCGGKKIGEVVATIRRGISKLVRLFEKSTNDKILGCGRTLNQPLTAEKTSMDPVKVAS